MGPVLDALGIDRRSTTACGVTFDHPPTDTITATTVEELAELAASSSVVEAISGA